MRADARVTLGKYALLCFCQRPAGRSTRIGTRRLLFSASLQNMATEPKHPPMTLGC